MSVTVRLLKKMSFQVLLEHGSKSSTGLPDAGCLFSGALKVLFLLKNSGLKQ